MPIENQYKVRLIPASSLINSGATALSFDASPNISESRTVNYNSLDPLHAPGQIQVYKNTSSRTFQISDIKLLSRTLREADKNLAKLWTLRSWCMPRFGNSSTLSTEQRNLREERNNINSTSKTGPVNDAEINKRFGFTPDYGKEILGAPPPILYLSAYSKVLGEAAKREDGRNAGIDTYQWSAQQHINRVPTVIQQLNIPYPNDVDYITTTKGVPMPLIMNIDITLIETHSPNAYEAFNLSAFKEGRLQGF